MGLPTELTDALDGPARALAIHLDERIDALEASYQETNSALAINSAMLAFNSALVTRLSALSPGEQIALVEALTVQAETAVVTPA